MPKFFVDEDSFSKCEIVEDYHKIVDVLRMRKGEEIIVNNGFDNYLVKIDNFKDNKVIFEVIEKLDSDTELPFIVDVFQGNPKGDKLDFVCKYLTQLGVNQIFAVEFRRSVVKINEDKSANKINRLNKIMKEASCQSNRTHLASFGGFIKLKNVDFSSYDVKICLYEEEGKSGETKLFKEIVKSFNPSSRVAIVVGPEGGYDVDEIDYLKSIGFVCVGLGKRILRTELAPVYALSAISYETELK